MISYIYHSFHLCEFQRAWLSVFETGMCYDINPFIFHWELVIPTSIHAATDMKAGFKLLLDELWLAVIIMLGSLS